MVKAIARAFRWREMLENGTHATIAEIAAAEKINESYVGRVLRLTLLAPDIVEANRARAGPAQYRENRKPLHDQRWCWIPVAPAAARYLAKVLRFGSRKATQYQ